MWVKERKPAAATIESWRYVFAAIRFHFGERSAASMLPEEAKAWIKNLVTEERSEHTVKRTWLNASKTVFNWTLEHTCSYRATRRRLQCSGGCRHRTSSDCDT
jgi:hypothetical protein